ncbi:MAG: hypothetical protein ABSC49_01285 [Candidatus Microgenomates bacterium]|jgi:hypothetical protein
MEPDGITRLYYYHEQPYLKVVEVRPDNTDWKHDLWTTGQQAKEIYDRAEFVCVNVHFGDASKRKYKHIWSVHPKDAEINNWFTVRRTHGYSDQDYLDLIRKLERRTHKKGLTVLIS